MVGFDFWERIMDWSFRHDVGGIVQAMAVHLTVMRGDEIVCRLRLTDFQWVNELKKCRLCFASGLLFAIFLFVFASWECEDQLSLDELFSVPWQTTTDYLSDRSRHTLDQCLQERNGASQFAFRIPLEYDFVRTVPSAQIRLAFRQIVSSPPEGVSDFADQLAAHCERPRTLVQWCPTGDGEEDRPRESFQLFLTDPEINDLF
jgi:hypothetical protein